jgi:hypothetical protein
LTKRFPRATGDRGIPPHWPSEDAEDRRIRMGCPGTREDLLHRYREVLCGVSVAGWTESDYLDGFRCEWALADLRACEECTAIDHYEIRKKVRGEERVVARYYPDCRSVAGGGHYLDLHRKRTQEAGKPVFVMVNCAGPTVRRAEIARRQVQRQ